MNRFKGLNDRVITWANAKGILEKATSLAQIGKTEEEVEETKEALTAKSKNLAYYENSKGVICDTEEEIADGFGDILVTVLIGCKLQGLDPMDCLETALNVIEKRTGKMEGGTFVKDN